MKKNLKWLLSIFGKSKPASSETTSSSVMLQDQFLFGTNTDASLACEADHLTEKDPACVLRLQREVIDQRMPSRPGSTEGPEMAKMPDKISRQSQAILELGTGYFSWSFDQSTHFYVRSEKRVYYRRAPDSDWNTYPMLANVHFRVTELYHRQHTAEHFLQALNVTSEPLFVMETSLGMQVPKMEGGAIQATDIESMNDGNMILYRHQGKDWAELELSDYAIPEHCQRSWRLFLTHHCHLHPAIRECILQQTRFPQTLTYRVQNYPREVETTLRLVEASEHEPRREWPVASGFHIEHPAEALANCLHGLETRLPINLAELYNHAEIAVRDAVGSGNGIDGFLSVEELYWILGSDSRADQLLQVVAPLVKSDPLAKELLQNLSSGSQVNYTSAVEFLKSLDRTKLKKGDLLDIHQAELLEKIGNTSDYESLLLRALARYPLLAGIWYKLGNHFGARFRHLEAWHCFDAARKINSQIPELKEIDQLEAVLLRDFADYF